jgi:hypothetical protein
MVGGERDCGVTAVTPEQKVRAAKRAMAHYYAHKGTRYSITQERLKEFLHYNPSTGVLKWIKQKGSRKPGDIVATANNSGYIQLRFDGCIYLAQKIIYFYMTGEWPPLDIDHKNRNGSSNRWKNLRLATKPQNLGNTGKWKNNTSGFKGVCRVHNSKRFLWRAEICVDGVRYRLGHFETAKAASKAYNKKAKELRGEFA